MTPGTQMLLRAGDAAYQRAKEEILNGAPPATVAQDLALAGELLQRAARALVLDASGARASALRPARAA
jgi:hypothetical protein